MSHPIRVLWSVPRSVSTSFERMMTARGDHTVLDEPFSRAYYFGRAALAVSERLCARAVGRDDHPRRHDRSGG